MTKEKFLEFVSNIQPDSNGCKIWPMAKDKGGYGRVGYNSINNKASRLVYLLYHNKELPGYIVVRHKCDNRACVNIEHLVEGTDDDNTQDMLQRGRQPRGETHHIAFLSNEQVLEIRELAKAKTLTRRQIAKKFGISKSYVSHIVTRRNRKDI